MKHTFDRQDYRDRELQRATDKAELRALRADVEKLKKGK